MTDDPSDSRRVSRWNRGRLGTAIGISTCLIVVLAWFSPWWIGGRNLAPLDILNEMMQPWRGTSEQVSVKNHIVSDAVDQYLIYRMVAAESYAKEGWLGWSTLTYGGTAQYANTMALYYDWTMQLHRWFGFWTAWHLGIMGQVMLAATGMLLFLRGRSIGLLWACCGALAYAANSQFVVWIYHRWTLGAFCWVPWILWAIDGYRRGNRSFWAFVPAFMALAILGGTLQHAAFVALAVMAIWGEEAIGSGRSLPGQTRLLGRYALWGLLGSGMAAMMLLPCADAFLVSSRLGLHMGMNGAAEMGVYPRGILQPLFNLAAYPLQIFPSVLGRCDTVDLLKVFKSELFYVAYFGSLPVLVAFLAFFRKQTPVVARLLIGTGLLLPLTPLVRLLYQRLYLLFILGGILAFTHFMETASAGTKKRVFKATAAASGLAILAWCGLSVVIRLKAEAVQAFLQRKIVDPSAGSSFGYFREWMQGRADKFAGDLFIWSPQQLIPLGLFLAALAGLRLTASVSPRLQSRGMWMIVLAVICEVTVFGARWITFADPGRCPLYPMTREVAALRENVGDGRVATMIDESGSHMAVTPFIPNTLGPYGIATIHGYDSIMPNGMLLVNDNTRDTKSLGRLGVTHLITYPGNRSVGGDWMSVWKSPAMELFENPAPVPRYIGFHTDREKDSFFGPDPAAHPVPLAERTRKENTREIELPPGLRWIRIAENAAPGWEYKISNSPAAGWQPVQRAPDASMLLQLANLPPNVSASVAMRYNPPLRRLGFETSAAALLLTLLAGLRVRFANPVSRHP